MLSKLNSNLTAFLKILGRKNPYFALVAILAFVFILDCAILLRPQLSGLVKLAPKIETLKNDLKKIHTDAQRLPEYQKELEHFKKSLEDADLKVQLKQTLPLILEQISRTANQHSIKIDQITQDNKEEELLMTAEERQYFAVPIVIHARSGYHDFGKFLNQIETNQNFLLVKQFTINAANEAKLHDIQLTLEAIVYEEVSLKEKPQDKVKEKVKEKIRNKKNK